MALLARECRVSSWLSVELSLDSVALLEVDQNEPTRKGVAQEKIGEI